jgi:hypothetical protein
MRTSEIYYRLFLLQSNLFNNKMTVDSSKLRNLDTPMIWLTLYFFFNLSLTLYNKIILALYDFPFPWTLTAIHTLCGAIGSYCFWKAELFTPAALGEQENMVMLAFSVLYTINIAISNVSL